MHRKVSLVIPAYNEAGIIASTLEKALVFLGTRYDEYELILSDDGSTDATRAIAEKMHDEHLRLVGHMPNHGKGSAVREGILSAEGDVIVCTDADLAYGLEPVPALVELTEAGADLSIGSRLLCPDGYAEYPPLRRAASRTFHLITGRMAGFSYDTQCGIKAYSRAAAREIFSRSTCDGFAFDFEVLMLAKKLGFKIAEYPVKIVNQRDSKVHVFRDSLHMLGDIRRIKSGVEERFR